MATSEGEAAPVHTISGQCLICAYIHVCSLWLTNLHPPKHLGISYHTPHTSDSRTGAYFDTTHLHTTHPSHLHVYDAGRIPLRRGDVS